MEQCICKVVDVVISPLVSLVTEHLTYLLKAEDNLDELKKVAAELAARRKDVDERIQSGRRTTGGTATNEVSEWLQGADRIVAEAEALHRRYSERTRRLRGCSVEFWSSYAVGKTAAKMIPDARREFDRGVFEQVVIVLAARHDKLEIDNPPAAGREYHYLDQALEFINDDAVKMVGIWGMGGVGKTHLLKSINNSFARQTSFDVVIFVTASRACSVARIQSEIMNTLGLPTTNNAQDQARIISDFLREKDFLLLLDDVWERLDLGAVGVPMPSAVGEQHKRKVVLTTRYLKVCGQMGVSRRNSIKVECLDGDDAWLLFRETVGEDTIGSSPAVEALARKVARKLGGLPLALITVGRAMYDKEDPREWGHAIDLLQDARHDEVDPDAKEESLFHTLKFSYDRLRSDALRDCLLCCSLWPEDFCIPKNDLILCLLGLGVIDGFDDMQSAYNIGYDLIASLRSACLLNDDDLGFGVRVHDVIRDMALWIACGCGQRKKKWFVKAGLGLTEAPPQGTGIVWGETDRVSLMHNRIEAFLDSPGSSSPAALTTLMLQRNQLREISLVASASLAALTYLDLSHNKLNCFPENVCQLTTLRYLNLSFNQIPELPVDLKLLTSLEYLILRESNVQIIPAGVIRELEALQMLDLRGCHSSVDLKYPPSLFEELETLNNLKALGFNVKDANQLNRLDELRRTRIRSLYIFHLEQMTLPLLATPLGSSRIQNSLIDMEIAGSTTIEEIVFDDGHSNRNPCFHNLEKLSFHATPRLNIVLDRLVAREVFPRLCILDFSFCYSMKDVSWIVHLPCLRVLAVRTCTSVMQLISSTQNDDGKGEVAAAPTFPSLKRISLADLPALQCVCDPAYTFPCLEQFEVRMCRKLTKLPFRADTIPKNLKFIRGDKRWWEGIEWEDDVHRSSLKPFFLLR
ncbi:disease resistance protein RPS5-like [Ananas comosus]|uniref:Disease resistance protein RPS5-like n=1 Tax=Ananas comosus TaxID=4615 RepID=A0A6P5EL98_ANACO|nr:disease resistance protein RPS5-like [Ananas comosus]